MLLQLCVIALTCSRSNTNESIASKWKQIMVETGDAYYNADFKLAIALTDSAIILTKKHDKILYAKTLNRKAQVLLRVQRYKEAKRLALLSLQEAEKTKDKEAISDALNVLGNFYSNRGEVTSSKIYYEKSLKIAREIDDKFGIGLCLNNLGTCMEINGYYPEALRYYNNAIEVFRELDSLKFVGMIYGNMAVVYEQQQNFQKAINFQKNANNISRKLNNIHGLIYGYENLGALFNKIEKPDSAIKWLTSSLRLADNPDNKRYEYMVYNHLNNSFLLKKEPTLALKYAKKSKLLVDSIGVEYDQALVNINYAKALYESGNKSESKAILSNASVISDKLEATDLKLLLYDTYIYIFEKEPNYLLAHSYLKKWQSIKNNTLNKDRIAAIERENIRFKVSEKDKQLVEQKLLNETQRWLITALSGIAVIVFLITGLLYFRSQNMKNRSLFLENERLLLEDTKEQLLRENKELLLSIQQLQALDLSSQQVAETIRDKEIVFFTKNRMKVSLKSSEVKYIEQKGDYSWVVPITSDKKFQIRGSLSSMENFLSPFSCFIRVQQSYIVNLDYVVESNRTRLKMTNDFTFSNGEKMEDEVKINLGREYQDKFLEALETWRTRMAESKN